MIRITKKELETNIDKYIVIGCGETIEVTNKGKVIFTIVPEKEKMIEKVISLFGSVPREAYYDKDIDRE